MWWNNLVGILADEMGWGKTTITLALLAWFATGGGGDVKGPHLIVCLLSILRQWRQELERCLPMVFDGEAVVTKGPYGSSGIPIRTHGRLNGCGPYAQVAKVNK